MRLFVFIEIFFNFSKFLFFNLYNRSRLKEVKLFNLLMPNPNYAAPSSPIYFPLIIIVDLKKLNKKII